MDNLADAVGYQDVDGVAIATLDRPPTRNALSAEMLEGLSAACERAAATGARCLVITGTGRTFCAGGDLGAVTVALEDGEPQVIADMVDQLHGLISCLRALPLPTVCAVNGAAVGAGVSLAMATDVRVLARSASFVTGYIAVGASPDGGASFHLARALGAPQALASLLLNRRFPSDQLLSLGLADEVVDDGELASVALGLGRQLGRLSVPAVRAMRELVYGASSASLESQLQAEKRHFLSIADTQEFRDGVAPFAPVRRAVVEA